MCNNEINGNEIAIIGMAGRFPKSNDIYEFWDNIVNKKECISYFTDDELKKEKIDDSLLKNRNYIKAKGVIDNIDLFDADFFNINPKEAEVMDPQHRILLECAWESLENAGYNPEEYDGLIGVYAGKSMSSYLFLNLYPHIKRTLTSSNLQGAIGNDKDSLPTTISYRLNLHGPSINIQSSSSTSLTAIATACQSLLTYECDIALAGGVSAGPPVKAGYLYDVGGIMSSDGHCRPFDADSSGFVPGNGYGLVVLKRYEDAVKDNDNIWAVIKGYAINNDGSQKVSYTAPSVDAQSEVVVSAQFAAGVNPEKISYVEAHGTATALGDPIEVSALTQAFRYKTDKKNYCALGSVKGNIGHLDCAAGVAGLIKVALSLHNKILPPTVNYERQNPEIDFENSPFYVNTVAKHWSNSNSPRIAGISSLGMGGTNVHLIVQENLEKRDSSDQREWNIIPISAKTESSLKKNISKLANYLKNRGKEYNISDVAYTLSVGRKAFNYRKAVVCKDIEDCIKKLNYLNNSEEIYLNNVHDKRNVNFMFTGQGSQYMNMASDLYEKESVFKEEFDKCINIVKSIIGIDLKEILFKKNYEDDDEKFIAKTSITQPLIFIIEYCMSKLLISMKIEPSAMIGHSLGEYVSATISGVFSLEDALNVVCIRAKLMDSMLGGAMLTVEMEEDELQKLLNNKLNIAAVNSSKMCVLSGDDESISIIERELKNKDIFVSRLRVSHGFHSYLMKDASDGLKKVLENVKLNKPLIPFISCVTGTWIKDEEALDSNYWAEHMLKTVRFKDGIETLMKNNDGVLLEVGPGNVLCKLAKQSKLYDFNRVILGTIKGPKGTENDNKFLQNTIAELWSSGVKIDWNNYYSSEIRKRVPLATYAFDRKRYWIDEEENEESNNNINKEPIQVKNHKLSTYHSRPSLEVEYIEAQNEIQQNIIEILQELISIKPIGIKDNFFDIGGNSLLATQLLTKIGELYDIRLSLNSVYNNPTVEELSKLINLSNDEDLSKIDKILSEIEAETNK